MVNLKGANTMSKHRLKPAQECGCNDECCAVCNGVDPGDLCEACSAEHNSNWSSMPTACPGVPMSAEQKAAVVGRELDYHDGHWVNLRPPMTVDEMVALSRDEPGIVDAEGFKVVRLDHLRDEPPALGLTVWRPNERLHAPTTIMDVTILGDGYDYVAVRQVAREGLVMPTLVAYHAINPFLTRFAIDNGVTEIAVSEILGSDNMIFVQTSMVPLVVFDKVSADAEPTARAAE